MNLNLYFTRSTEKQCLINEHCGQHSAINVESVLQKLNPFLLLTLHTKEPKNAKKQIGWPSVTGWLRGFVTKIRFFEKKKYFGGTIKKYHTRGIQYFSYLPIFFVKLKF